LGVGKFNLRKESDEICGLFGIYGGLSWSTRGDATTESTDSAS
jgi:hypothetical protein